MIKVFTKEKISKVIITHLFTREEINQYFDGNVFIDHPELNPQDYIVLDENNDFTHPTYDEELQAIREMTYDETKLLEVEPLIDGEYIEDGKLITVEYDESLGYYKKAWDKENHIWYEGTTHDEFVKMRADKILEYSQLEEDKKALENSKFSTQEEIQFIVEKMQALEKEINDIADKIKTL
ncbi:hypothetical protein [Fusobacterium mortiferum]|uniref:hypothetical protein n=1 Tax=Fusobacterium mortiferum TaxID=850 RepID=UPI0022E1F01E|nr:hypothetical protein [Fusobacterium mortiferum]